jgi:hypothetical protein
LEEVHKELEERGYDVQLRDLVLYKVSATYFTKPND